MSGEEKTVWKANMAEYISACLGRTFLEDAAEVGDRKIWVERATGFRAGDVLRFGPGEGSFKTTLRDFEVFARRDAENEYSDAIWLEDELEIPQNAGKMLRHIELHWGGTDDVSPVEPFVVIENEDVGPSVIAYREYTDEEFRGGYKAVSYVKFEGIVRMRFVGDGIAERLHSRFESQLFEKRIQRRSGFLGRIRPEGTSFDSRGGGTEFQNEVIQDYRVGFKLKIPNPTPYQAIEKLEIGGQVIDASGNEIEKIEVSQ